MLRCPTCTSLLPDPDVKRCPACRSKIRRRSRPEVLADTGLAERPRPLVERELQARIEAKTAEGFRQRRRAAKVARRIAALPPTVFGDDALQMHAEAATATPHTADVAPTVIDLPDEAVHDVRSQTTTTDQPVEPEVAVEPEVVEPEVVEPEVVEPEVVEPAVIVEPEVVDEPAPVAAASWQRSSSLWTDRVFNTAPRVRANETVSWPPRWKPAEQFIDRADDAEAVDYAAPAE